MNTNKGRGSLRKGGETIIAKACRTIPDFAGTYTVQIRPGALSLLHEWLNENH
jgi:hypothetical protein